MIDELRPRICREILERAAAADRIRVMSDELCALGHASFALGLAAAIRFEHIRIDRLAHELGLPPLMLARDVAAFARAQLGLPIDAPLPSLAPRIAARKARQASWERDLAAGLASHSADSNAA